MSSLINTAAFTDAIKANLNADMQEAAQPIIDKALQDIEAEMRKCLQRNLVGVLDSVIVMERMGTDIRILIRDPKNEST